MMMEPLEVFEIKISGEDYGAEKYKEIISDILQDLGLIRSIGRLYIYADMKKPYFAVFGLLRGKQPPLKVRDIGDVIQVEKGYQITVEDEEHMSNLLEILWNTYGREKVEQPERNLLIVESDISPEELTVADVEKEFRRDLTDALVRITPEGFRNRRNEMREDSFLFLAAEETIGPDLISEIEDNLRGMQNA